LLATFEKGLPAISHCSVCSSYLFCFCFFSSCCCFLKRSLCNFTLFCLFFVINTLVCSASACSASAFFLLLLLLLAAFFFFFYWSSSSSRCRRFFFFFFSFLFFFLFSSCQIHLVGLGGDRESRNTMCQRFKKQRSSLDPGAHVSLCALC